MIRLALLRHGATAWNAAGRLQGRSDVKLSPSGRDDVAGWRLPDLALACAWQTSPLARCRETAALLRAGHPGLPPVTVEPRLVEMDFGDWEGQSLAALRASDPQGTAAREACGLDFAAPGGESPRAVQARLAPWLGERLLAGRDVLAVTHKGVIRALYAQATGWPMLGRMPTRLDLAALQLFALSDDLVLSVERLNLPLRPAVEPA
jgi:broad specificity phosphatase PhoE